MILKKLGLVGQKMINKKSEKRLLQLRSTARKLRKRHADEDDDTFFVLQDALHESVEAFDLISDLRGDLSYRDRSALAIILKDITDYVIDIHDSLTEFVLSVTSDNEYDMDIPEPPKVFNELDWVDEEPDEEEDITQYTHDV